MFPGAASQGVTWCPESGVGSRAVRVVALTWLGSNEEGLGLAALRPPELTAGTGGAPRGSRFPQRGGSLARDEGCLRARTSKGRAWVPLGLFCP